MSKVREESIDIHSSQIPIDIHSHPRSQAPTQDASFNFNGIDISYDEFIQLYSATPSFTIPESVNNQLKRAKQIIERLPLSSKILIFTDSNDFDGVGGGAIQYLSLTDLGFTNISIYGTGDRSTIPDDINEYDLVITNDVGISIPFYADSFINSEGHIKELTIKNKSMIITDHHISENDLSKLDNHNNVFIDLPGICGAYISYLLFSQFESKSTSNSRCISQETSSIIFEFACIATISDSMPINSFNKSNIQKFYSNIRSHKITSKAFYFLIKDSIKYFDFATLAFNVNPKLNAPMKLNNSMSSPGDYFNILAPNSSLNDWRLVMKYLLTNDFEIYTKINELNEIRKSLTSKLFNEITGLFSYQAFIESANEDEQMFGGNTFTIYFTKHIIAIDILSIQNHISGLIASKLNEYYKVPVIVNSKFTSSIRGKNGLKFLRLVQDCLQSFGGHEEAAGFRPKCHIPLKMYSNLINSRYEEDERDEQEEENRMEEIFERGEQKQEGEENGMEEENKMEEEEMCERDEQEENKMEEDEINNSSTRQSTNVSTAQISSAESELQSLHSEPKIEDSILESQTHICQQNQPLLTAFKVKDSINLKDLRISLDGKLKNEETKIASWVRDNIPFQHHPIFIKTFTVKRTFILKKIHTKIISSDGSEFLYFFNVKYCDLKCGDVMTVAFKIGNSYIIEEVINVKHAEPTLDTASNIDFNTDFNTDFNNIDFNDINFNQTIPKVQAPVLQTMQAPVRDQSKNPIGFHISPNLNSQQNINYATFQLRQIDVNASSISK